MGTSATVRLIEGVRVIQWPLNTGFTVFSAVVLVTFLQITKILRLLLKMSPEHFGKKTQRHLESSNEFTAAPCPRNFDRIHQGREQFRVPPD